MGRRIMGKTSAERQRWKTEAEEGWSVWGVQEETQFLEAHAKKVTQIKNLTQYSSTCFLT